jgi:hypothetical protein
MFVLARHRKVAGFFFTLKSFVHKDFCTFIVINERAWTKSLKG